MSSITKSQLLKLCCFELRPKYWQHTYVRGVCACVRVCVCVRVCNRPRAQIKQSLSHFIFRLN